MSAPNCRMVPGVDPLRIAPSASTASALAGLYLYEFDRDVPRIAMPRPESHLVVRFGPSAHNGVDVHAFGAQQKARRKLIRGGQRTVMARLQLGAHFAVFGVPGSAISERIVALEDLWGKSAALQLTERLAEARSTLDAAKVLEHAIAERLSGTHARHSHSPLALDAASKLPHANVNRVADELGVSERHLRRVFRETVGISPKTFAKLSRFHRALRAAYEDADANWATIAATTGYYDQAHLIAEFRGIAGATPQRLLGELRNA